MKSIDSELPLLKSVMKLIAEHLGKSCEVVLHDWSMGYDKSVVAIENGDVTGRTVGSCGTNFGLPIYQGNISAEGDKFNYVTQTKDGRYLRSSTIFLSNENGEKIGALCINLDISDLICAENTLKSALMLGNSVNENKGALKICNNENEHFAQDVNELLEAMFNDCVSVVGKTVSQMTRDDKVKAINYLDEKGAFLISKANVKACEFLNISKYSLYTYLEETRKSKLVNTD